MHDICMQINVVTLFSRLKTVNSLLGRCPSVCVIDLWYGDVIIILVVADVRVITGLKSWDTFITIIGVVSVDAGGLFLGPLIHSRDLVLPHSWDFPFVHLRNICGKIGSRD
jgi:hypothetical protein